MNTTTKKIDSPVQLWCMLGPLFIICTMLVIVLRPSSTHWGLPLAAFSGVLMCYQWRWKGLVGACVGLAAAAACQFSFSQYVDPVWTCVLILSILSSFVVTVLFLNESQSVLDLLSGQSSNYNENLAVLEEKLAASQNKLESERQVLTSRIEPLKRELAEREEKLLSYDKLVAIVREELISAHSRHEKLLQELFDARQQSAILEQQLERAREHITEDRDCANESIQAQLKEVIVQRETEIVDLSARLAASLEEERMARQQAENYVLELMDLREQQQNEKASSTNAREDQMIQQAVIAELHDHIENLFREKQLLESTLSSLQGELEILTVQLQEKTQVIDIHHATIQSLKTALDVREEELEIVKTKSEEHQKNCDNRERSLLQQIEDLTKKLSAATQQLAEWQRKLHDYTTLNDKFFLLQTQIQEHITDKQRLLQQVEKARHDQEMAENNRSLSEQRERQLRLELEEIGLQYAIAKDQISANEHIAQVCDVLKEKAAQLQSDLHKHIDEKAELIHKLEISHRDIESLLSTKAMFEEKEVQLDAQIRQMNAKLQQYANVQTELELLQRENQSLKSDHIAIQNHIAQNEKQSVDHPVIPKNEEMEREMNRQMRRMDGLYQQLREQFAEKAEVLDETRRTLFKTQEGFSALQKEVEEVKIYGDNETEKQLYQMLNAVESDFLNQIEEQQKEMSLLYSLLDTLIMGESLKINPKT